VQLLTAPWNNALKGVSTLGILIYPEDGSDMFLRSAANNTPEYTVSYVRRRYCACAVSLEPNGFCFEAAFMLTYHPFVFGTIPDCLMSFHGIMSKPKDSWDRHENLISSDTALL
jgi:hypothetical protein